MQDTDVGPGLTFLLQWRESFSLFLSPTEKVDETQQENTPAYVEDLKELREGDKILTSTPGRPGNPASPAAPGFPGTPFGPYMR